MLNKYKRYALRCFISLYIVYMAIATFAQHQSYTQLFAAIVTGFILFGAGRMDKGLEAVPTNDEMPVAKS